MKRHGRHQEYVFKVRDVTQQYVEQVRQENEKLRLLVRALQDELEHRSDEVSEAREKLDRERAEREQLKTQVAAIEYENRRISEHYVEIERQNNDLAHLYVASYRLHETLNRDEVIQVVQEIVANLIGSEEMAIFEMQNGELKLLASHGIDAGNLQTTSLDIKRDGRDRGVPTAQPEAWTRATGSRTPRPPRHARRRGALLFRTQRSAGGSLRFD